MGKGSKKREKLKQEKKGSLKRNLFNGFMIIAVVLLIVVAAITLMIFLYTRKSAGQVVFPQSPLTKMMDQPYSYIKDERLDITIQCPTIPVLLNVGGSERYVSDNGCVFRYSDSLSISIYEVDTNAYDILSTDFASNLYGGEMMGTTNYLPDATAQDVGYFNGFPSEYQCGVIEVSDENNVVYRNIYVLSLVIDLGLEKDLLVGISCTDDAALYEAELLMENIAYTVVDGSITQGVLEKEKNRPQPSTNVSVTVESELEEQTEATQESKPLSMSGFDAIYLEVPLLKNYEEGAVVVLQYTNIEADVSGLQLKDMATNVIAIVDSSSTQGLAFFGLKEGRKGNYTLSVPADVDLGIYSTRIMGFNEFMQEYATVLTSVNLGTQQGTEEVPPSTEVTAEPIVPQP